MSWKRTLPFIVLLATLITISFNGLANALPLNGQNTGEVSDRFQSMFVPAGYVFSIWGLIYIGILTFSVYQVLPSHRDDPGIKQIRGLFTVSCLANMSWLYLWHYEHFVLTVLAMLVLLFSLVTIYLRLRIGREPVEAVRFWCLHVPFSMYLGWITVATVANISTVLVFLEWEGWGISSELWTLILISVAAGISAVISITRGDAVYALVLMWAFIGIAVKQSGVPVVAVGAWTAMGVTGVIAALGRFLATKRRDKFRV